MLASTTRILTTHAGSLPRSAPLVAAMAKRSRGETVDAAALDALIDEAIVRVVRRQHEVGIDVANDGEQQRESFFTHVRERMSGFGGASHRRLMQDLANYPDYTVARFGRRDPDSMVSLLAAPQAVGEVRYVDTAAVEREADRYRRLLASTATSFAESFMTAPSPGIVACAMENAHYPSFEEYVVAVAEALRTEYQAIVGQGFVLQIDAPDLAMERHTRFADRSLEEFLEFVDLVVRAMNRTLARIPPERVRLHVCWGNYEGPHDCDVPLDELLPHLTHARVGGVVLSMANPRHQHEHRVLRRFGLPSTWLLVAGAIDTTTNYVEHPEVVAERIERAADAIGDPRRVLAGTDCGFDSAAGLGTVVEEVAWAKLRALREGADLATRRLLG